MKRRFRLANSTDFKRVRQFGTSFAHPLVVLVTHPNDISSIRVGVSAGLSVGGAVQRNLAKRRLRAAIEPFLENIQPGRDIVLIARKPLMDCQFIELQAGVRLLLQRAGILIRYKE